ncbi:expressed unknown protein [Seminavis robusta]|uniref:Uncharacterized protein n=1 Tax=Seminavis robusta TaxID=568900 RepID=A0A9N8HDW8_9STRA|nr:expressed unknown protein [Seminavis robusta]|eukprot:Sro275_g105840.1 n/a (265) ;mRNA; f:68302-69096
MEPTSTCSTPHQCIAVVAQLNNQGVQSLAVGQDSDALCFFKQACFARERCLPVCPTVAGTSDCVDSSVANVIAARNTATTNIHANGTATVGATHVRCPTARLPGPWMATTIPSLADDGFYIANQAMCFKLDDQSNDACPGMIGMIGLILLFNTALALHCDGLKNGDSEKLQRAINAYASCISIISSDNNIMFDSVKTVALFCWNNLAQILYRCQASPDLAVSVLRFMESFMATFKCDASKEIAESIFANAVLIPSSPLRAAVAA